MIETDKVTDMSYMFSNCSSLSSLSDISTWNTENVTNMSYLFNGCASLKELPDISYWNTEKVTNMSYLFYGTSALKSVPDISKWNVSKLTNILNIFSGGITLDSFPDMSKWHKILFNLGKAKENEEKKEYVYLSKDCYYFTCKNCKNTPEVIIKDNQTVLLKCNSCNIFENEKIEKIRNFQSPWLAKMSLKPCNKHGEAEAVKYCAKCSLYLCPECLTEHDQNNKGHPLTDVANMVYNMCGNHSKEFSHFCIDCRKEICTKCQAEHKKHKMKISSELYMQDIIDNEEEKKEKEKDQKPGDTKSKNSKNEKKSDNEKKDDTDEVIWYGDIKTDEKRSEKNDKKSENKSLIKEIKEDREEDKDKEKENNKEANAIILSCSLFEAFFSKAAINTVNKNEIVKNALLTIKVYEEIDSNFKKMLAHYPNEFNKKTENDLNLLILSKIIFFTSKQLKNFDIELLSNLNYALNSIVPKINEQAFGDFKDYMNSKNKEFTLCLQKVSDKEFKKLQANLDYLLAPVHKSLSDSDKTSSFASKIYESSKILQKYIAFEKMREPDKLLNIDDAFNDPRILSKIFNLKDDSNLVLSLLGKLLQKYNINVSVFKNKDDKLKNIELTSLNSLLTMANKKSMHFFLIILKNKLMKLIMMLSKKNH
jgi:surface protein